MEFEPATGRITKPAPRISGKSPGFNLPIGIAVAGPVFFVIVGALIVVLLVRLGLIPSNTAPVPTASVTPTITLTSQPSATEAPTFTPTNLPPIPITVQEGETCLGYSVKYHVPSSEIIKLNNLVADCTGLIIGQIVLIPQPTPTQPPPATATYNAAELTKSACPTVTYDVKEGDALSTIATNYNVSIQALKEWNPNIAGDTLFSGLSIIIPLCRRLPTEGPSPTPTIPPPYPPPNPLTPRNGVLYGSGDVTIALQWASVDTLRENEMYQVTVEDMTSETAKPWVDTVSDTRYIVPSSLQPADNSVHMFRWSVAVVRQTGSTDAGEPIYVSAGSSSEWRYFNWGGTAPVVATATP